MAPARRSPFLLAALIGVFFLSVYLLTGSSDLKHNGDTDLRYQTAQAIADYHRLWIAHPMWLDTRVAVGLGHHLYAFYAPGQTLLMVPLYVAGRFLAHHLSLPYDITTLYTSRSLDLFLGALLAMLFFLLAVRVGYSARTSVVLTLIFGLATVAWPDAQSALEQTQVDLFLLLAVYGVWSFAAGGLSRRRWLLLAGGATGLAIFTRYDAALFLPVIAGYPASIRWMSGRFGDPEGKARRGATPAEAERFSSPASGWGEILRDWLLFAAAAAPWIVLVLLWNAARFGSPFQTGLHEATFWEPPWLGFLGLTVSPGKGLIWYLPLVFLLPWALPRFYRQHPSLCVFFGVLTLLPLAFYSNVLYWHGDPAWGPRYLYTAIPYLVLPLGTIFQQWKSQSRQLRLLAVVLIGISFVLQVAAVSVTQWRFWYRLEAQEERTSQPFRWGARYYHYYWNLSQSPIVMQLEDVYQVVRLDALGDRRYDLSARPTVCHLPIRCISNPADNYPVNTLAFWWADVRHPLLGLHTRATIALGLGGMAAVSLILVLLYLQRAEELEGKAATDLELVPAGAISSRTGRR